MVEYGFTILQQNLQYIFHKWYNCTRKFYFFCGTKQEEDWEATCKGNWDKKSIILRRRKYYNVVFCKIVWERVSIKCRINGDLLSSRWSSFWQNFKCKIFEHDKNCLQPSPHIYWYGRTHHYHNCCPSVHWIGHHLLDGVLVDTHIFHANQPPF